MKWLVLSSVVLLFATSCNKYLDIQPAGELTNDQLLRDANGFESALYGVYASLPDQTLYGANLSHNALEVLAQYFACAGNDYAVNLGYYNYKFSAVETALLDIWKGMYANIANANNVIQNLERFNAGNLQHFNLYKGEALGLRAFLHFDLLRLYTENIQQNAGATGIPYSTDFKLQSPEFFPAAEVYSKIIADLKEAENLLQDDKEYLTLPKAIPADNFLKDREIHFNLYAVQATLARVYFTKGDLPNALIYAEKVINSGKFRLLEKSQIGAGIMKGVLFQNETIFGLYSNSLFAVTKPRFLDETSFFSYNLRDNLKTTYALTSQEGNDYRWAGFFQEPTRQGAKIRFVKLVDPFQINPELEFLRPAEYIKGINMIRLPEMYYIAAEALLGTNPDKARDYFDLVLKSRGITALKDRAPAQALTLDQITADRYKEFIGEGQTFFNMKRLHKNILDIYGQTIPASKSVYVLPIPLVEFDYRK